MLQTEMNRRRKAGLGFLQLAINELGPIADATRHSIREPVLDLVDEIHRLGEELQTIRFDVYDTRRRSALK